MLNKSYISLIISLWLIMPAIGIAQDFKSDLEITDTSDIFWEQLYFPDTAKIYCIDVNENGDIFVGTGGVNVTGGVYRSTDNAQTWDFVHNLGSAGILSIDISPQGDIFAGSNNGWEDHLIKSSDNGNTWQELLLPEYTVNENIIKILAVSTDTIYVSTINNNAMLLRTYDGGVTWDSLVGGNSHISEYISDILINDEGTIYLAYSGFVQDFGGVYFSDDNGSTWQFSGFYNYMITSLAENSNGDIFAGCWGGVTWDEWPGLYVLRDGETIWDTLIAGPQIDDIIINGDNHIYFSSSWPDGIVRSLDDGNTFELINDGIPNSPMGDMTIDTEGFIYLTAYYSAPFLAKSVSTTVDIEEIYTNNDLTLINYYPNPVSNTLTIQVFSNDIILTKIRLLTLNGIEVLSINTDESNNVFQIDVSHLKPGIYLAEINNNKIAQYYKFIKH